MKPTPLRLLLVTALVAALATGGWLLTRPDPLAVETARVERGVVEATVVNTRAGTIKACRRAKLAPPLGGQIAKLWVKEGDRVDAGQPLLELWNRDLAAQRVQAERQLDASGERRHEACIAADQAQDDLRRNEALAAQGFVSEQRVADARSADAARRAGCRALDAEVRRARAQLDGARAGLERSVLNAPFAGIVARVTSEVGEFATPSPPGIPTPPTIDLIDDSCLYLSAPMDEVDAPRLVVGQAARISLDALPGRQFAGKLRRIAPVVTEVEKQARTVEVEIDFAGARPATLLVGYSADAEVVIAKSGQTLRIPSHALRQDGSVLVLNRAGVLEARTPRTGLSNWAWTEVKSGLAAGDEVVTSYADEAVAAGAHARTKAPTR